MFVASDRRERASSGVRVKKSLTKAERNYSQIELEALSLIFGTRNFDISYWVEILFSELTIDHY